MHPAKIFLWIIAVPFVLLQAYWTFAPEIGIMEMYGFWQAFPEYFALNQGNGLLMAGLTDFMTVALIAAVWMVSDTPKERRWGLRFFIWLASYIVFPGLGFLVYFLYLNPDHRFVSSGEEN